MAPALLLHSNEMPTPRLPRTTDPPRDPFDDLIGELSEVQWLGAELSGRIRAAKDGRPRDDASIWARLLAWTE